MHGYRACQLRTSKPCWNCTLFRRNSSRKDRPKNRSLPKRMPLWGKQPNLEMMLHILRRRQKTWFKNWERKSWTSSDWKRTLKGFRTISPRSSRRYHSKSSTTKEKSAHWETSKKLSTETKACFRAKLTSCSGRRRISLVKSSIAQSTSRLYSRKNKTYKEKTSA